MAHILRGLSAAVPAGSYRPGPIRRGRVSKPRGGHRTLSLGDLCDRVLAAALHKAVEPLWESVYLPCSYGFRPGRGTWTLLAELGEAMGREGLTWEFVRLVQALRPRAFVLENVKALATLKRWGAVRARLLAGLGGLGYAVGDHLLDARAYGVPQGRQRVFFVGTAAGLPPVQAIRPTVERPRTAGEVLRGLPSPGVAPNLGACRAKVVPAKKPVLRRSPFAGMLFNGQGRPLDLRSAANTLAASMGGNQTPIVDEEELREGRPPWVAEYHARLLRGLPSLTEAPDRLRRLTVTEAALLQTFPADFHFEGRQSSQYAQIGNAVPPPLAEAVAGRVLLALQGIADAA